MDTSTLRKRMPVSALADPKIIVPAIGSAFAKLNPRVLIKNPVMFVVEIVAALTTVILVRDLVTGGENLGFTFQIVFWLWITVLFANFSEAVAEGRGKAQANTYRNASQVAGCGELEGLQARSGHEPESGRHRPRGSRRHDSLRRRGHRGCRLGQRGGDHR
jgi:high-affinity K+ transport system ATPase subunit B